MMTKPLLPFLAFFLTTITSLTSAQKLTSNKAIPEIKIPENSELTLIGDHKSHGIVSPTALSIDEQGNILITETWRFQKESGIDDNRQRRFWIKEDIASQTTSDRLKLYEKYYHKIKPEHYTTHSEKVRRLTDSNNDGKHDANNIFAEGFNNPLDGTAAGIYSYNGTTYLACIPHIWTLKDKDGDGVADERKSLQEGFGVRVSFSGHDLNGFAFGPDGRIYATVGDRGLNIKTKEGKQWALPGQGAIIRFDPDGSNMEVIHTGLRNPKEIAFDEFGNAITVDNNSDQGDKARVVYIVDQADSGWRMGHQIMHSFHSTIGIPKHPINRWMAEKMWQPENDLHPSHILPPLANYTSGPSGLTYDPGVGAHPDYTGKFLICDYRGGSAYSQIFSFGVEPNGSGMKFVNPGIFNKGVSATDVEYGYDGSVYVTDYIGGWSTHQRGRIYKITPVSPINADKVNEVKTLIHDGVEKLPTKKLSDLLGHPDMRIRLRAQFALANKEHAASVFTSSVQQTENRLKRLHGIWGLGMLARKNQDTQATAELCKWSTDSDDEIRAQVMKVLAETPKHESTLPTLANGIKDKNLRVSSFAALSIGRHKGMKLQQEVIDYIINSPADAHTRHSGAQALIATTPDLASLQNHANHKVRLATVLGLRKQKSPALIKSLNDRNQKVSYAAIRAIHDQLLTELQPEVAKLLDNTSLKLSPMMQKRLIHSAYRTGGAVNIKRLCDFSTDKSRDLSQRQEALRLLGIWLTPSSADQSIGKHAPFERNPGEQNLLKSTLVSQMNKLFESENFVVKSAFQLAQKHQLELPDLNEEKLKTLVQNEQLTPSVRAQALGLLVAKSPETGTTEALKLASHKDMPLTIEALKTIVQNTPEDPRVHLALIAATKRPEAKLQQQSWLLFKGLQSEQTSQHLTDSLLNLRDRAQEHLSAIEIIEVAKSFLDPNVKDALQEYLKSQSKSDPLAKWHPSLHGGDPEAGERIFRNQGAAQCAKCHHYDYLTVHDGGGNAGPNLAGIGKRMNHMKTDLLEAIMLPNTHIAAGFGTVTIEFEKGNISGNILDYQSAGLVVQIGDDPRLISHADYKKLNFSKSAMPSMRDQLTLRETRDVVAFLDSLTSEKGKPKVASIKAKPFDLSELKTNQSVKEIPLAEKQKQLYDMNCMACHQAGGVGNETFPPLANSEWVRGDKETLIKMQLLGLSGPIKVRGKVYEGVAMPSNARLSDTDIASILTYIRTNPKWGNNASEITASEVAKVRKEVGNSSTPLDATALVHPKKLNPDTDAVADQDTEFNPHKPNNLEKGLAVWDYLTLLIIACFIPVAIGFIRNK